MNIDDRALIKPEITDIAPFLGQIVRWHEAYYMVVADDQARYGFVNMGTGCIYMPASDTVKFILQDQDSTLMPNATLTIGDPQ